MPWRVCVCALPRVCTSLSLALETPVRRLCSYHPAGEFRQHVRALGLEAASEDIDNLFKSLDDDGGGTLDMSEIRHALRKLQEEAAEEIKSERQQRRRMTELQKVARAAQMEWKKVKQADEAADAEATAAEARLAEERALAAAEARAAKAAALAEKKAAAAIEKAAFEAKVAARQKEAAQKRR